MGFIAQFVPQWNRLRLRCLRRSHLEVGLWSGRVVLQNICIRSSSVNTHMPAGFRLVEGTIRSLVILVTNAMGATVLLCYRSAGSRLGLWDGLSSGATGSTDARTHLFAQIPLQTLPSGSISVEIQGMRVSVELAATDHVRAGVVSGSCVPSCALTRCVAHV